MNRSKSCSATTSKSQNSWLPESQNTPTPSKTMYTLTLLDYTAELIELTYDLGTLTRKHVVPVFVTIYVAVVMTIEFFRGPSRARMTQKLTQEWERIMALDPVSQPTESLEWVWYLESLSDEELRAEYLACTG